MTCGRVAQCPVDFAPSMSLQFVVNQSIATRTVLLNAGVGRLLVGILHTVLLPRGAHVWRREHLSALNMHL